MRSEKSLRVAVGMKPYMYEDSGSPDGAGEFVAVGAQEFALNLEVHDDFAGCFVGEPGGEGGVEFRVDGAGGDPEAGALRW